MKAPHNLREAVVDSSAIMSIFDGRPSRDAFKAALKCCDALYMSAGTLLELSIIFISRKDVQGPALLDSFLASYKVFIVPFDEIAVATARQGCVDFGKRRSKADLNYGDLFSYALAKARGMPLFYEGLDFLHTDLPDAMALLGYSFDEKHAPVSGGLWPNGLTSITVPI
ncbi:MAG: type II toxin-antitoxin system VapC family toxin [Ilumatobacteraceae bacterium]|jgi:ribonuclease VapC|nr:type II toxin-antitoxin system VapC family toxin [Ilumatobacteraceae bacterium]